VKDAPRENFAPVKFIFSIRVGRSNAQLRSTSRIEGCEWGRFGLANVRPCILEANNQHGRSRNATQIPGSYNWNLKASNDLGNSPSEL
jgi:hypothetical protein